MVPVQIAASFSTPERPVWRPQRLPPQHVLSLPIATLVSDIDSEKVLEQNLKIVRNFKPMAAEEMTAVENKVRPYSGDGRFELFKSSKVFDGPNHRKQHGFSTGIS